MRFSVRDLVGGSCLCAALLCVASPVSAQPSASDKAAAEALFDQAQELMQAGKVAAACSKFEQSQRIDPAIGTLLYLGDCYEKSGRLASAWATFREGASMARTAGQTERAEAGEKRAALLGPQLGKLVIVVDENTRNVPGLVVERGGTGVNSAVYGSSVPVDAGIHQIRVTAPGYRAWDGSVDVKDGAEARLQIPALAKLPEAPTEAPVPASPAAPEPVVSPPPSAPPDSDSGSGDGQRTAGIVLGGVGVAGVIVGSIFGITAINKNSDAEELCPKGDVCDDPEGVTLTDDAKSAALVSNIAFGVGGAALIGGAVLYLTAPTETTALRAVPAIARDSAFIQLGGRF